MERVESVEFREAVTRRVDLWWGEWIGGDESGVEAERVEWFWREWSGGWHSGVVLGRVEW